MESDPDLFRGPGDADFVSGGDDDDRVARLEVLYTPGLDDGAALAALELDQYFESLLFGDQALGCIAGSACLGMLIPPSLLLIVYGVLAEVSIGRLFLAAVLPARR